MSHRRDGTHPAALLIDRLLVDPSLRVALLRAPQPTLDGLGLGHLAPGIMRSVDATHGVGPRESRSALGGMAVATAVAAIGVLEFPDHGVAADAQPATEIPAGDAIQPPAVVATVVGPVDPALMIGPNAGGVLHQSEYHLPDPEGAPGPAGPIHAGYDLFAEAGAPVRAPVDGTIVEASPSRGTSGQIFGGVVKVQAGDGRIWVFRHVIPAELTAGGQVAPGQTIATISPWTDGTSHVHIELWRGLEGGYDAANMDDPFVELGAHYPLAPAYGVAADGSVQVAVATQPSAPSKGRASGVFQTIHAPDPPPATVWENPVNPVDLTGVHAYPGDAASPPEVARWMGSAAQRAGLPAELPVMASLVESGMRNINYGDRDSVGFFQMRTGIWDSGPYAGYPQRPDLQLQWFVDRALAVKAQRIAAGDAGFGHDSSTYGEWIADIERPAAEYRGRYQLRLEDARHLLVPAGTP